MNALERASAGAAVMRRASARSLAASETHEEVTFTVAQRIARYGLTALAIVLASALFASQIHATLL